MILTDSELIELVAQMEGVDRIAVDLKLLEELFGSSHSQVGSTLVRRGDMPGGEATWGT